MKERLSRRVVGNVVVGAAVGADDDDHYDGDDDGDGGGGGDVVAAVRPAVATMATVKEAFVVNTLILLLKRIKTQSSRAE